MRFLRLVALCVLDIEEIARQPNTKDEFLHRLGKYVDLDITGKLPDSPESKAWMTLPRKKRLRQFYATFQRIIRDLD